MAQIVIENLNKTYSIGDEKIRAVDGVSLSINKGEFPSIVGHSGSGKTTLLSIIGGLVKPTSGRIMFEGTDIWSLNKNDICEYRSEKVGFVCQFACLLPTLTVKENLLLPGVFRPKKEVNREKKAIEFLDMIGLLDKTNHYPSQLSGGQQRRVVIARALMNDPEIIVADEPTGDLDEATEAGVMKLFKKINRENDITIIMVTHSRELASQTGRIILLSKGKTV